MEKRKWYYTAGGKVVRGFFCMVTFAAFMAGLIFVLATEMNFGGSVFSVNPKEYYDTPYYSSDVAVMYSDVLGWIAAVDAGKDKENESIEKIDSKCINCGYCKKICDNEITVGKFQELGKNPICINCGQCANICPTEAITEKMDYLRIKKIVKKKEKKIRTDRRDFFENIRMLLVNLRCFSARELRQKMLGQGLCKIMRNRRKRWEKTKYMKR